MHTPGIAKEVLHQRLVHLTTQRSASRTKIEMPKHLTGHKSLKEVLPATSPIAHHHISAETRNRVEIADYLDENEGDPALEVRNQCSEMFLNNLQNFVPQLLNHLLARLLELDRDGTEQEFSDEERATIIIENNRLFCHQVLRINYTTYDNQWSQDTINPRTRPDIMMLSGEDHDDEQSHPYWYAQVIEIFHV